MRATAVAAQVGTPEEAASVARLLSRAGLVEAFGHVSVRTASGFAITSTLAPLGAASAESVLAIDDGAAGAEGVPLEAPLHAAIYEARPDVGAICRTHSPAVVAAGLTGEVPPVTHGLGTLSGTVASLDQPQLVIDDGLGASAARALGEADCLLLRANGAVATADTLGRAAVRAWYLEERARLWRQSGGEARVLSDDELRERSRHSGAESERAWRWLRWRFGDAGR